MSMKRSGIRMEYSAKQNEAHIRKLKYKCRFKMNNEIMESEMAENHEETDKKNKDTEIKEKKVKCKKSKLEKKTELKSWAFLTPSLLGVSLFFIVPFMVVIYYAFINNVNQKKFVGLKNIIKVFKNDAFRQASRNTLIFSFVAVPLAVVLALLLAILLDREIPYKSQFRTAFLTPMMVPIASIVLIFQIMFHYNGIINEMLEFFGKSKIDWLKSEKALVVVIIMFLWKTLGYNMILFMSALSGMPQDLIEVARLESANRLQIFFKIKLRYLSPTIMFVTLLSLINSFKIFREVYLLSGDYPCESLYMLQHYMNNMFNNLDYQKLSASAIIMCLVMIVIISIMFFIENYFGKDVEE